MSRILLGVSGGIAAYKALEFVRLATGAGHAVRVVQTPSSRRFVGEASFAALTGAPVLVSEFERDPARGAFPDQHPPAHEPLSHLALVEGADVLVIAPASANTIAKLAAGLADNLLSSCALAASCPLLIAPAMNSRMYEHPATRANLETLAARGARILEPGAGRLASKGEEGIGRMAEPGQLLAACEEVLAGTARAGALAGVRVLVTAGGTREPIDGVRFIGNNSSGRMGIALARAARERGAEVTLIAANVALPVPPNVRRRAVVTAAELERACEQEFPACEVLLMAAAVSDFTPSAPAAGKLERTSGERLALELRPTGDVLAGLAARRREGQTLVGFAAEHGERALARAREKLARKGLDAIVVNDVSRTDIGFDAEANEVTILIAAPASRAAPAAGPAPGPAAGGEHGYGDDPDARERHVPRADKDTVAGVILDAVEQLRAGR